MSSRVTRPEVEPYSSMTIAICVWVFSADQSDNVVGILLAKDLLPFLTERNVKVDIRALMRQPLFVPESARSDQVLRMLKNTQTHIENQRLEYLFER